MATHDERVSTSSARGIKLAVQDPQWCRPQWDGILSLRTRDNQSPAVMSALALADARQPVWSECLDPPTGKQVSLSSSPLPAHPLLFCTSLHAHASYDAALHPADEKEFMNAAVSELLLAKGSNDVLRACQPDPFCASQSQLLSCGRMQHLHCRAIQLSKADATDRRPLKQSWLIRYTIMRKLSETICPLLCPSMPPLLNTARPHQHWPAAAVRCCTLLTPKRIRGPLSRQPCLHSLGNQTSH